MDANQPQMSFVLCQPHGQVPNHCVHFFVMLPPQDLDDLKNRVLDQTAVKCLGRWADWTAKMRLCEQLAERIWGNRLRSAFAHWGAFVESQRTKHEKNDAAAAFVRRVRPQNVRTWIGIKPRVQLATCGACGALCLADRSVA